MSYTITTDKTWTRVLDDLDETFRKWQVSIWRVSCELPANKTTRRTQTLDERRVIVRWKRAVREYSLTMDKQARAVDNLLVLQLAIEALRLNEKRGIAQTLAEAYRQEFPALPAPGQAQATLATSGSYTVLHIQPGAPLAVAEAAWRALLKEAHPDKGGSVAQAARLNTAIEQIRKERAK